MKDDVRKDICALTSYKNSSNLGDYLGAPLIHGRVGRDIYRKIVDKIRNRLAGWKATSLSFAGRVTLAKFVIGLPKSVCEE